MVSNILRKLQKLAVLSVISVGAVGSATAGLFCNMQCCQQPRAYFSPACEPAWGYHQTCWRKFPELEPCSGWGDYCPSCTTDGGVTNAYQPQGMQFAPAMQYESATPIIQGPPTVMQQPVQNFNPPTYNAPMQGYQAQQYDAPPMPQQPLQLQPMPQQQQLPLQPMPQQQQLPMPQQQPLQPLEPLPASSSLLQIPGGQPFSQSHWQQNIRPAFTPQGLLPANSTQGLPVQAVSISRVQPTDVRPVPEPKRSLLQRILPGGK